MNIVSFDRSLEPNLLAHLARHWAESGRDGPHFLPFDLSYADRPRGIDPEACSMDFREPGWQRWLLVVADGVVYGHCNLKSDALRAGMHRCELGMGLEVAVRSSGLGARLLERALQLARSATTIDWVDLRVLGTNRRAIALYEKFGFQTIAVISDRFRIDGESIDEVMMTRRLAAEGV